MRSLLGIIIATALGSAAFGADLPKKALAYTGYPVTRCGFYYGIGMGGNAGAVNGAVVGTQIVQGDISGILGYTCPFGQTAFWFGEAQIGFSALNGSINGLSLSGPLVSIQRVGVGSPINAMLGGILPDGIVPAIPSLPALPVGVTTSSPAGYIFAGLVEQDISAQIGLISGNHQWVVAPMIGLGMLTQASNRVAIDTWAGWQMNSNSYCPGGGSSCAKLGNMARVGVSLKY